MIFKIISTGSKGNAVLLDGKILIDCGVAYKKIKNESFRIVLLTHKHGDHFNNATIKKVAYEHPTIRFACGEFLVTKLLDCGIKAKNIDIINPNCDYDYGFCIIRCEPLHHDVPNYGWHIKIKEKSCFYATDTANLNGIEAKNYDLYLVEANYTEEELKERIAKKEKSGEFIYESRVPFTHLSKKQAQQFISDNARMESEFVYLHGHVDS